VHIPVAPPPEEIKQLASEGTSVAVEHTPEVSHQEVDNIPHNDSQMEPHNDSEIEEAEDNTHDGASSEIGDKSEQRDSPAFQFRVQGVGGIATYRVLDLAVDRLLSTLPDITAFRFSEQSMNDFYPIRLQIGVCREEKAGNLRHLWIYLKRTKPSPHVDYIIDGTVSTQGATLMVGLSKGERRSIPHEQLRKMLDENTAELYALFSPFGTQKQELQALAKYGYILAAESPTFDGLSKDENTIPINETFATYLKKVCQHFDSKPVDYWSRSIHLPLKPKTKGRDQLTNNGQNAALDAVFAGRTGLNHLPPAFLRAVNGPSSSPGVVEMQSSSGTPVSGNNTRNTILQLAEEVDQVDSLVTPAQHLQASRDDALHSVDNNSEDIIPRSDQHLRARGAGALPFPDNEIAHVRDEPMDNSEDTQEIDEIMEDVSGDTGRQKSNSPVPKHLSSTFRSDGARRDRASPSPDNGDEDTERQESRTPSSGPLPHISPSDAVRNAGMNRRVRSARRSETVRGRGPVRNAREAARKRFAKIQEGRRVIDRRVKKDRKDGNKNLATILNLLVKSEHLRARGNDSFERLAQKNRNLEDLVQGLLQESSHGDSPSREPSFASFSSDEAMDNDNLAGEDDNDVDM
jgi:hypothetical protein